MAVSSTARKQLYDMDGVTVAFAFTFSALESTPTDIKCKVIDADGEDTDLTYTTDYSVVINSGGSGGTVTVVDAQSATDDLLIYRETTDKQESDYADFDQFPADTVEQDFDRRTMVTQELSEGLTRTVQIPIWSAFDQFVLPDPTANYLLGWNSIGTQLTNVDPDTLAPVVALKHTPINSVTDDYTLVLADDNKIVELNSAGTITLTVPSSGTVNFESGTTIGLLQAGAGQVNIATIAGVTIHTKYGFNLSGQYAGATLYKKSGDTWYLNGDCA